MDSKYFEVTIKRVKRFKKKISKRDLLIRLMHRCMFRAILLASFFCIAAFAFSVAQAMIAEPVLCAEHEIPEIAPIPYNRTYCSAPLCSTGVLALPNMCQFLFK